MRKLTRKEVAAISAVLGVCSVGAKHAFACSEGGYGDTCLQQITIHASTCPDCDYIPLQSVNQVYTPPYPPAGPSYTPGSVTSSSGSVPPFNPANNPHCAHPGVDTADLQSFISPGEGNDAAVEAMTGSPHEYGKKYNNETGYVPWTNGWSVTYSSGYTYTCPAGADCYSGFTTDGIDLGQFTADQLIANGVPSSLVGPTGPLYNYTAQDKCAHGACALIAPTGWRAQGMIAAQTDGGAIPIMSAADAQSIFMGGYNWILGNLQTHMGSVPFGQLPNGTQEALMDYAFSQDGGNLTGIVLFDIQNEDWRSLGEYLLGQKSLRLALEGAAILADIREGKLPNQGGPC